MFVLLDTYSFLRHLYESDLCDDGTINMLPECTDSEKLWMTKLDATKCSEIAFLFNLLIYITTDVSRNTLHRFEFVATIRIVTLLICSPPNKQIFSLALTDVSWKEPDIFYMIRTSKLLNSWWFPDRNAKFLSKLRISSPITTQRIWSPKIKFTIQ